MSFFCYSHREQAALDWYPDKELLQQPLSENEEQILKLVPKQRVCKRLATGCVLVSKVQRVFLMQDQKQKRIGKIYNFSELRAVFMVRLLTEIQTVKTMRSQIEMRNEMLETQAKGILLKWQQRSCWNDAHVLKLYGM